MDIKTFSENLIKHLPRLMQEISHYENNYVTSGKITCQQFLVLDHLKEKKNWKMHEIAELLQVSHSTMTGMIDRLENHNLVKRTRSQSDRRIVYVSVTTKGRKIVTEVLDQKKEGFNRLFSHLSEKERQEYLNIITKLSQRLAATQKE